MYVSGRRRKGAGLDSRSHEHFDLATVVGKSDLDVSRNNEWGGWEKKKDAQEKVPQIEQNRNKLGWLRVENRALADLLR